MSNDTFTNINQLINLYSDSQEGLLIVDAEKTIIHMNKSAYNLIGQISDLSKIEHHFSFDVCILNENDLLKYNPIVAALNANQEFKCEALLQVGQNHYKNLICKSMSAGVYKVLILSDLSDKLNNSRYRKQIQELDNQLNKLSENNKEFSLLKEKAEAQAIRTGLINRISTAIRDSLDIDEIIEKAIGEISRTLGVYRGIFANFHKEENKFIIEHQWCISESCEIIGNVLYLQENPEISQMIKDSVSKISNVPDIKSAELSNTLKPRLITPVVYHGDILGMLMFYHNNVKRTWHTEEISLVEGIASQLAVAISQASLFEKLENQNRELELTLVKLQEAQTQLVQSEKMASLGQLVAGVAHEINTPIGAINSNNDVANKCLKKLKDKVSNQPDVISILEIMENSCCISAEAIRRINAIVKSLKNFARLDEAEVKEVDIREGIQSTLMLISHEMKNKIKIIEEYSEIPFIKCYPNLLNQVFMNILVNACQSIDESGIIKIKTELANNKVRILISDTGKGIPQDQLVRIFDPGFTTKGVGVGTGLGLSICYQIIDKHGGSINVDSQVGVGTTFIIVLPVD